MCRLRTVYLFVTAAIVVTNDLFGDADDISDSDGEAGGVSPSAVPAGDKGDSDASPSVSRPKARHIISDDEDDGDARPASDRDARSRSREASPKQQVCAV